MNTNDSVSITRNDEFQMIDLGDVYLRRAPIGEHRWQGQIQVMSTGATGGAPASSGGVSNESLQVDQVFVIPIEEGYGAVRAPSGDATCFANRSMEIRSDGVFRESEGGLGYSEIGNVTGALPRLPVGGYEQRITQVFARVSRGDLTTDTPDTAADDSFLCQIVYRPSFLFVPEQ